MSALKSQFVCGLLAAMLLLSPYSYGAQSPFDPPAVRSPVALWLAEVSIEAAIRKAKAKYGGKVLSATEIRSKGPLVYKIKLLLPNGRIKTVFVDGKSGEVFEA